MMATLMLMSIFVAMGAPQVMASEVVLTDAVQIVNGGAQNDRMVALDSDSEGNVHFVWSRNTQHLYYKLVDARGDTLIEATQISNPGQSRAWHPDIAIDDNDRAHIVWADRAGNWAIKYTVVDPSQDDLDGSIAIDASISVIDDFEVSRHTQNRDWPAIDVDSFSNAHIVWEDSFEELDKYYQQPQIYYAMIEADVIARTAIVAVDETL